MVRTGSNFILFPSRNLPSAEETITVRQLLAHQAGLFAFDEPVDREVVADFDRLALVLARQAPAWKPGMRQAYHPISLGFYQGELLFGRNVFYCRKADVLRGTTFSLMLLIVKSKHAWRFDLAQCFCPSTLH